MEKLVSVRVGGKRFETHPDTLRKIPYFAAMLDRFPTDGEMTADRDPRGFRHILNHARDPSYSIPAKWAPEIAFYGLEADTVDVSATMPEWFSQIPALRMDKVNSDKYIADFGGSDTNGSLKFVSFRAATASAAASASASASASMTASTSMSTNVGISTAVVKPIRVEMWYQGHSTDLCPAQLQLLRALLPKSIRVALDAYAAMTGIHTFALPCNAQSVYVIHFSEKVQSAYSWMLKVGEDVPMPVYYGGVDRHTYDLYWCALYDHETGGFVYTDAMALVSGVTILQDIALNADLWRKTGIPIWKCRKSVPVRIINGYVLYYFADNRGYC